MAYLPPPDSSALGSGDALQPRPRRPARRGRRPCRASALPRAGLPHRRLCRGGTVLRPVRIPHHDDPAGRARGHGPDLAEALLLAPGAAPLSGASLDARSVSAAGADAVARRGARARCAAGRPVPVRLQLHLLEDAGIPGAHVEPRGRGTLLPAMAVGADVAAAPPVVAGEAARPAPARGVAVADARSQRWDRRIPV